MSTMMGIPAPRGNDGSFGLQTIVDATPRLDELSTARLIQLIAEAAHGKTVALSPAAIVVESDAKIRLDAAATTAAGYLSPEKLKGGATDRRSDVFSVGVLMWEALSHTKLFEASSDEALAIIVQELEPRPPSENNANIPSELDAIVMKALSKDPAARYQSLKVMAAEIDAVLSDSGYAETNDLIAKFLGTIQRAPTADPKAQSLPKITPREAPKPAADAKKIEEARKLDDAKKAADAKAAADAKVAEAKKAEEAKRAAEAKKLEESRKAEEARQAEARRVETKRLEDVRKAEEAKKAEAKKAEEAKIAEATRKMEEATRASEATRAAELAKVAEAKKAEEAKKAATAAEAAKQAASEAAAAIEAAKAAATRAAEAIKAAETAEASKVEASKAAAVAQAESVKADSAKHVAPKSPEAVAAPRTISSTLPAPTIAKPKLDPSSFDPARSALGAPAAGSDTRPLTKAELNRTMLGVAPGPELVRPASSSQPPPISSSAPAVLGLPAMPPGAEMKAEARKPEVAEVKPPVVPADDTVHDAVTQRVPKRGKSDTGSNKKFDKNRKRSDSKSGDERTTKFEKGDPTPMPEAAGAVALPRSDRASGKIDVWFSSTDSVASISDDDDQFEPHKTRSPMVYIGGAVGLAVVVIVLAIAFSGGNKDKKPDGSGSAIAAAKPSEPPPTTPMVPDPNVGSGSAEAAVGSGSTAGVGSGPAQPAVGSGSAEVAPPPPVTPPPPPVTPPPPITPPPPPAPKTAGMVCAATTECAGGLTCTAGACTAPKPIPVVKPPEVKKPPEIKKPPPPLIVHKPAEPPVVAEKPKVDPQEALKAGLQQYARGETGPALASFRSALASNPGFSPAYRGMGLVYEKMGNKAQARIAYKKYLQLAPTAGDADQIRERMERL